LLCCVLELSGLAQPNLGACAVEGKGAGSVLPYGTGELAEEMEH
jgi:hypothetical protein